MALPNHWMTAEGSATVVFPFLSLTGPLVPSSPKFEREQRAGVDGIGLWLTGSRGEPFQIVTTLDCANQSGAASAYASYGAAILSKKDLYYCGSLWGTVMIQNVVLQSTRAFRSAVGGVQAFTGGAGVLLTVQWTIETLDL